jgi:hypothetical protein
VVGRPGVVPLPRIRPHRSPLFLFVALCLHSASFVHSANTVLTPVEETPGEPPQGSLPDAGRLSGMRDAKLKIPNTKVSLEGSFRTCRCSAPASTYFFRHSHGGTRCGSAHNHFRPSRASFSNAPLPSFCPTGVEFLSDSRCLTRMPLRLIPVLCSRRIQRYSSCPDV